MGRIQVAVLGATGMIGQRFAQMLEDHPRFEIEGLYASERSEGRRLAEALRVRDHVYREETLETRIRAMDLDAVAANCRIAFSGLPSDLAGPTETALAAKGVAVFSNAGAHRMDDRVPIVVPEANPEHMEAVRDQPSYSAGGFIVTNANCSTTGAVMPLKAIAGVYPLKRVFISTYQALSGAGYPGVPSLDAVGNVVPYIGGEEEKMESELGKILGGYTDGGFAPAGPRVVASCARVPVVDGHVESLAIEADADMDAETVREALRGFRGEPQRLGLHSAPDAPIIVREEEDRPQPVLDALAGTPWRARGMACTVGRVRGGGDIVKLFLLSHNTLRGGAGGSVLNAELADAMGLLR